MIGVRQTENWNCHAACIASVLELSIDNMPEISPDLENDEWHDTWGKWLSGLGIVAYDVNFNDAKIIFGYTIGVVKSQRFEGSLHSIVCLDGEPVWDPQILNDTYTREEVETHHLLVPLDPSVLVDVSLERIRWMTK